MDTSSAHSATSILDACVLKKDNLLQLFFQESVKKDDVAELVQTAQKVEAILRRVQKNKYYTLIDTNSLSCKIFQRSLEKLDNIEQNYLDQMLQIQNSGKMDRFLNNTNLRKKIEQLNSSWLIEAEDLEEKHEYLGKEVQKYKQDQTAVQSENGDRPRILSAASMSTANLLDVASSIGNSTLRGNQIERKKSSNDIIPIEDPESQKMWSEQFGSKTSMVESDKFIKVLCTVSNVTVNETEKKALKHILDNSNTGFISAFKFSEFLKGFGPLMSCIQNVSKIVNEKWFYGFLSKEEAAKFLEFQPPGTFLIRFSSSKPGSFALAFTAGGNRVTHVIINTTHQGFSIREQETEKLFQNLHQIIQHYASVLKKPFDSTLPKEPFFFGDLSAEQAEEYLSGKRVGTFLIRFSSNPGFFAGSYVDMNGEVAKCLIASSPAFHLADKEGSQYGSFATMKEFVQAFNSIFKFPYKNTTNSITDGFRKKIATEIYDTERTYIRALDTLLTHIVNPLKSISTSTKPFISHEDVECMFSNLAEIKVVHNNFYEELQQLIPTWSDETLLGESFLQLNEKLFSYTTYINNYNSALETFGRCMKNEKFVKFIETTLAKPECELKQLPAYLIQPVQRIPRYILLLSDLIKHTTSDHEDYESLTLALEAIKESADYINESKRLSESHSKVFSIEASLVGNVQKLAIENRYFIREGTVQEKIGKVWKERHIILLSDMILHTKDRQKKQKRYQHKHTTNLKSNTSIMDFLDNTSAFKLISDGAELIFQASSDAEKNAWVSDIKKAVAALKDDSVGLRKSLADLPARSSAAQLLQKRESLGEGALQRNKGNTINITKDAVASPQILKRTTSTMSPGQNAPAQSPASPGGVWKEAIASDGRKYYYHSVTKETTWTKPY